MNDFYDDEDEDMNNEIDAADPKVLPDEGIVFSAGPSVMRALQNEIVANIVNAMDNRIRSEIDTKIKVAVDEAVSKVIGDRIGDIVQAHLDKPRQKTDAWGTPTGPSVAFADLIPGIVENYLNQPVNSDGRVDGYGSSNKATRSAWIIGQTVKNHIDPVISKTVTDITNQAKMAISSKVGAFIASELTPQIDAKGIESRMKETGQ